MTAKYKTSGKLQKTMIAKYKELDPGISDQEAYDLWKADMRARGSKGGQNSTGAFAVVPGLAQRAARIAGANKKK